MGTTTSFKPKPLRDTTPNDIGGSAARSGFAFQDHVAAKFCLQMLTSEDLREVWCETYDDIVLVWSKAGTELMEFIQVKHEEALNQLYSVPRLMKPDGKVPESSIFERSLGRDKCAEEVRFRLVTSRETMEIFRPLKADRDDTSRASLAKKLSELEGEMAAQEASSYTSANGHDYKFWIQRTLWETHTLKELQSSNHFLLAKFLELEGLAIYTDTVKSLYEELLWLVKSAAENRFDTDREAKFLRKSAVRNWLLERVAGSPTVGSNQKLTTKLVAAAQPPDSISSAIEMRMQYNQELRQPRYLQPKDSKFVTERIIGNLHSLRAKLDSGEISTGGSAFHNQCVETVIAIKSECDHLQTQLTEVFVLGCMYEITSRCRHRFVRPTV